MKLQTVQIVRQGEATPYWFKFNPLYELRISDDLWLELEVIVDSVQTRT